MAMVSIHQMGQDGALNSDFVYGQSFALHCSNYQFFGSGKLTHLSLCFYVY